MRAALPTEALQGAALPIDAVEVFGDQVVARSHKVEPLGVFIGGNETTDLPVTAGERFDSLGVLRSERLAGEGFGVIVVDVAIAFARAGAEPGAVGEEEGAQRRFNPGRGGIAELFLAIDPEIEPGLGAVLNDVPRFIIGGEAGTADEVALRIIIAQVHPAGSAAGGSDDAQGDARVGLAGSGVAGGDDPLRIGNLVNQGEDGDHGFIGAVEDELAGIRTPPVSLPVAAVDFFKVDPTGFAVQDGIGSIPGEGPRGAFLHIDDPEIIGRDVGEEASIGAEADQFLGFGAVGEAACRGAIQFDVVEIIVAVHPLGGVAGIHLGEVERECAHGFEGGEFLELSPVALGGEGAQDFAGARLDNAEGIAGEFGPVALLDVFFGITEAGFLEPGRGHRLSAAEIGEAPILDRIESDGLAEGAL